MYVVVESTVEYWIGAAVCSILVADTKQDESKMKCESCGKQVDMTHNRMCVDCYVGSNLPTEVQDRHWVYAPVNIYAKRRYGIPEKREFDGKLALAITSMTAIVSADKTSIILKINGQSVSIPLTVEKIDDLAQRSGKLVGKWLIYRNAAEIDELWSTISRLTFSGELGTSAKASTTLQQKKKRHVVCVYTADYLDLDDVMRVRERLGELGVTERLCYKPDIYTYLGIYYRTTPLSPCRYRK